MNSAGTEIQKLVEIAKQAGSLILEVYNNPDFSSVVDYKSDNSPLTIADKKSNALIVSKLKECWPHIPIISEEEKEVAVEVRKGWEKFWLVDPLDGTKEFINRNGQFTVNIALIEKGFPVSGVIYAPVYGQTYFADANGAYKEENGNVTPLVSVKRESGLVAIGSKSHSPPEEDNFLKKYTVKEKISIGSSLKFCLVAEGKADIYYRHGPTMEWDTAAGQAIVERSGGFVVESNLKRFSYNKDSLLNSSFICLSNEELLEAAT